MTSNRKQRRASSKKARKSAAERILPPNRFRDQLDELAIVGGFANSVSMAQTGLPTTRAGELGSMVFAKCCAHARSIGAIALHSSMFDHHAIMTLARMIVEATTMLGYLNEPATTEEWALRHTVLRMHDTTTRIGLLRSFNSETSDLRTGLKELQAELEEMTLFKALPTERQQRLLTGQEMYVTGMRSVAVRAVGWDEDQFASVYTYLSAHTHTAPVSFMRMRDHSIDYMNPSQTQFEILAIAMEAAIACVRRSMLWQIDRVPDQIPEYQQELLAEMRGKNAACPFFKPKLKAE